jgi:hypothetical protein
VLQVFQVLTFILVALAAALALAHALELPGKMRLSKDEYFAVQPIYYPGFTIGGGVGEAGGTISAIVLLLLTPSGSTDFWLALVALLGLLGMQAAYWILTHPVNGFWLEGERLGALGSGFFSFGSERCSSRRGETRPVAWTDLRNRWEYSHVVRAGLSAVSFFALVIAIA